ncbi:MAG: heavy metal-binding domain-containing protein [Coriobacteriia bacterium]|nr:heavy metal-binding domain-containing protein [Coriobacteriia bacterium]
MCAFYGEKKPEPIGAPGTEHGDAPRRIPVYTTMDAPAGYRIERTIGLCWGVAVRSKDVVNQAVAGLRTIVGGEITEFVHLAEATRSEALERLQLSAASLGANAVIGARFDSTSIQPANEIFAYGTAVVVVPISE